jgi:sucrose phosphorylase
MEPVSSPSATEPHTKERPGWEQLLRDIYGVSPAESAAPAVRALLEAHQTDRVAPGTDLWTEQDVWLITYPDQFQIPGTPPLQTLATFLETHLRGMVNGVHILPFFPSTSDEGFSIADYESVDAGLGSWADIEAIAREWRLMLDAVVNHASAQGKWFEAWLSGDPEYAGFFRTADPNADLGDVVRARQHPLLTRFDTSTGSRWVWTTFSADQVDLDYGNPEVLVRMLAVLLGYAAHGADVIRLDAVGFLWKQEASPSIHLPETHRIIQFFRACLEVCYPGTVVITETNVPHGENIAYLGDAETPEAHAVYQFPLPPLTLHAFTTGAPGRLAAWLKALEDPPAGTTYLNFLSSHDGVGLRPLEGIIDQAEVDSLVAQTRANGGLITSRSVANERPAPYELNATWFDLVRGKTTGSDALARHLGSHAVALAVRGIPALYIQSLIAGENDTRGAQDSGHARAINRRRFLDVGELDAALAEPQARAAQSVAGLRGMIELRRSSRAFHPDASQRILDTPSSVLGVERRLDAGAQARVYVNFAGRPVVIADEAEAVRGGNRWKIDKGRLELGPWGNAWIIV